MNFEISKPMDYKLALYIRLSKEDDKETESQSITNQRTLLREFAEKHRLDIVEEYIDDGYSGTSFDRPSFQRMIQDIEDKKINMVLTKDMSRLGRDYIMTGHYMEKYFPENHVRYISLLDGIDTGDVNSNNDITPFKAIINDMYAKDISKKISSVKRSKQKQGLFIGGKAYYGYKLSETEKNVIEIDENVAPIVRYIFELALSGMSGRQIAMQLNEEKIPTPATYANLKVSHKGPYSGLWSSERVSEMLKNQVYVGDMVQGRKRKISYKSKKELSVPKEEWAIVPNTHEPIIDRDTFQKVQELLESRRHTRSRTIEFPLKGLVYCQDCGYPMAAIRRVSYGKEYMYLVCRTYQRFTKLGVCTGHFIKEDVLNALVFEKIQAECRDYMDTKSLQSIQDRVKEETSLEETNQVELDVLKRMEEKLSNKIDSVYMDKINGLLARDDFERIYEKIKEERNQLQFRIQSLEHKMLKPEEEQESRIEDSIERFLSSTMHNRELLVSLIERVEITADKEIIIHFKFKNPRKSKVLSFTIDG